MKRNLNATDALFTQEKASWQAFFAFRRWISQAVIKTAFSAIPRPVLREVRGGHPEVSFLQRFSLYGEEEKIAKALSSRQVRSFFVNTGELSCLPSATPDLHPQAFEDLPYSLSVTGDAEDAGAYSSLVRLTRTAGFSSVLPQLLAAFEHLEHSGIDVPTTLRDNIQQLQGAFVEALYTLLRRKNIDFSVKLTLGLILPRRRMDDQVAQSQVPVLTVIGEHPQQAEIVALLAQAPDLAAAFMEIAAQSTALKDLRSLWQMAEASLEDSRVSMGSRYQVSVKGEMNHFYFGELLQKNDKIPSLLPLT